MCYQYPKVTLLLILEVTSVPETKRLYSIIIVEMRRSVLPQPSFSLLFKAVVEILSIIYACLTLNFDAISFVSLPVLIVSLAISFRTY